MAVAALHENFSVPDDNDRGARDVVAGERVGEETLEPGLRVRPGQFACRGLRLCDRRQRQGGECEDGGGVAHGETPVDLQCRFL